MLYDRSWRFDSRRESVANYCYNIQLEYFSCAFSVLASDFIKYKSECDPEASAIRLSGILSLHLLSGRGLRTGGRSRRIRDLYCVVEVDHIHKARTVVRSGGVSFDWDEK